MPTYEVLVRKIDYDWYQIQAEDVEDARNNFIEGDYMGTEWDMADFEVVEVDLGNKVEWRL